MDVGTKVEEAPADRGGRGRHLARPPRGRRWLIETLVVVLVAVVVAVVLRTFLVATYSIPSGSMEPTLQVGDRILVNKLSYHLHGIGRSDIIVFSTPSNEHCAGAPVHDLVKRVVGLSGETISLAGGQVFINGKVLPQPWLPAATQRATDPGPSTQPYALQRPFTIPQGEVYVMGDNRTQSCDSRYWGPIQKSSIVGKVDLGIWPITRFHIF